jgi:alkylhydroperoxidase family enzyme
MIAIANKGAQDVERKIGSTAKLGQPKLVPPTASLKATIMVSTSPRLPPLATADFTDEQKALAGNWAELNFTRVMVQHPTLYKVLIPFAEKMMSGSCLPPRDREILIIRTLALCGESYEAVHHVLIARSVGMTDAEIAAARTGAGLSAADQILVRAVEELVHDRCLGEETWQALAQRYSRVQLMEAVFLVGDYTMMSMVTRSFGMQAEGQH